MIYMRKTDYRLSFYRVERTAKAYTYKFMYEYNVFQHRCGRLVTVDTWYGIRGYDFLRALLREHEWSKITNLARLGERLPP